MVTGWFQADMNMHAKYPEAIPCMTSYGGVCSFCVPLEGWQPTSGHIKVSIMFSE